MRSRRLRTSMAATAALALVLTACGDDNGDTTAPTNGDDGPVAVTTITDGVLTVCSDIPYPPFEFEDPDSPIGYSGFDIDLAVAMADVLDLEVSVVVTDFTPIQSGAALDAGTCDVAASAMTITEERAENVDFVDPYFDADQSLLVKADSGITALDDIDGQIGVQANTTGQAYAEENFDIARIVEFEGAAALFSALDAGTIEAILQDLPVNVERAQDDDTVTVVETYTTGEQYGFAVQQGNTDLLDALNQALAQVREDGTYDELYARYFEA